MKLVLATGNSGKVRELRALLAGRGIEVVPQSDFGIDSPEETGVTFAENAILKARHAAKLAGLAAVADDSGLEVDALGGRPGVYSARYAGSGAADEDNNRKLLAQLRDVPLGQRTARYRCVVALVRDAADPEPLICEGTWEGRIALAAAGDGGFGYDPLFVVNRGGTTAAQLPAETKNRLSHRGQAMRALAELLEHPREARTDRIP